MAEKVRQAIQLLREHNGEEYDDEDAATISKTVSTLRTLLAKHAKMADQAMGMGPKEKFVRRMSQGRRDY